MYNTEIKDGKILYSREGELVRISAVGRNAIRFQSFPDCVVNEENYNLRPSQTDSEIEEKDDMTVMKVGSLSVLIGRGGTTVFSVGDKEILCEQPELTFHSGLRNHRCIGNGEWKSRVTFEAYDDEHFFGLGHHLGNRYDQKGCSYDIINTNANCFIPYVYSSRGYGFLWNVPSTGRVELSANRTRWSSDSCKFIDYVVIAGTPREVSETLAELTGHAAEFPEWAGGLWQSKLRYETQEQLLEVARRYKKENIPLSVIIADYFHWTEQGEYKFDPKYWPDVKAMADELHSMGTRLYVSVWPTVSQESENYWHMKKNNMLIRTVGGSDKVFDFYGWQAEIDVTNELTREFVWSKLKENYIDNGVDGLWFDEAEPEIHPEHFDNLIFSKGKGDSVALLYPYYYSKMAYDGFKAMGRDDIIILTRCAYFGNQTVGSLVWSGDIRSDFETLKEQVHAAVNMAVCNIPWWNTDVGGFYDGNTQTEYFRELIVRWFQFGVFSQVLRLHGNRYRHSESSGLKEASGDPNELWSFGDENFEILKELAALRERLRPYIKKYMDIASEKGYPLIRPMFFEYPEDEVCYTTGEQYMFGDDIIFAPITDEGQTEKSFYIPGDEWILIKDGKTYGKGMYTTQIGLRDMVVLVRKGAEVLQAFACGDSF